MASETLDQAILDLPVGFGAHSGDAKILAGGMAIYHLKEFTRRQIS